MADTPTVVYAPAGTQTVPNTYTVAPTQLLDLALVQASFDGSGAGGDFIPCVSIYAQSGQLLMRASSSTVTSGDNAEVSWFPFAEPQTTAAPGTSGLPWCFCSDLITIPYNAGAFSTIGFKSTTTLYTSTGDNSIFKLVDGGGGFYQPQLQTNGQYRLHWFYSITNVAGVAGNSASISFTGAGNAISGRYFQFISSPAWSNNRVEPSVIWEISIDPTGTTAPHTLPMRVSQDSGSDRTSLMILWAEQVNPVGNPNF